MQQQKLAEEKRRQVRAGCPLERLLGWMLVLGGSSACGRARAFWSCLGLECPLQAWSSCAARDRQRGQLSVCLLLCRHCRRRRSGSPNAFLPNHTPMTQRALRSFSSCLMIPEWSGDSTSHSH